MAGYQTIEALRPILHRGPVPLPVVNRALLYKQKRRDCPTFVQIKRMIEMREAGHSLSQIVREVGFTSKTIYTHTKHVPPPAGGWPRTGRKATVRHEFVRRLHRAGFSYTEIAAEAHCEISTVSRIINGWPKRPPKPRPTVFCEKVVERVTGVSQADLRAANQVGATKDAKARAILYWLVRTKHPSLGFTKLAHYLGGVDRATPRRCYEHVEAVVARLQIKTTGKTQYVVERLWAADWREGAK